MLGIMNAWLQNSAVMGLVGVIIGSVVSFAGIIYSERVKLKTLEEELQYKEKEKRNLAYKQFLNLINQYRSIMYASVFDYKEYASSEEKVQILKDFCSVLGELDLYASKEIALKCRELYSSAFNIIFDSKKFQMDYDEIVELIKTEQS